MKTILSAALIFILFAVSASAEYYYYYDLINVQDIPLLGERTKKDAKLAKSLNIVIKRWNDHAHASAASDSELHHKEGVMHYNNALSKCKGREDENAFYACMNRGGDSFYSHGLGMVFGDLGDDWIFDLDRVHPFPTAKTSSVCKKILNSKIFLNRFNDYIVYDEGAETKNLIFSEYGGTAHVPSFYYAQIPVDMEESEFLRKTSSRNVYEYAQKVEALFRKWTMRPKMYFMDNDIYLDLMTMDEKVHFIFLFDKESIFLDQACKIESRVIGYSNKEKICKRVVDGIYDKISPVKLDSVINEEEIKNFNNINGYYDNNTFFVDYANEGENHILFNLLHASGSGMGCDYEFLAIYNPQSANNISYIGKEKYSLMPSVFGDCSKNTREDLISIDKKTIYWLEITAWI
jgi:hypothetical protein